MKDFLIKFFVGAISTVLGIISIFFVFDNYLSDKIDEKITNPEYIRSLAKTLRPFLIFDQNEIFIYDHGVTTHIDSIKIHSINPTHLTEIIIYFNKYFQTAPFLESLGPDIYDFKPIRGKGNIWILDLEEPGFSGSNPTNKFRLELLL